MSAACVDFDLVIRSRIEIDAPPELVWKHLAALQEWKESVVSVERLSGDPDSEGETLRVGQRPADVVVHTLMRTVRLEPCSWKVQTLQTEDGRATQGYVLYALERSTRGTNVSCEVVARCSVPVQRDASIEAAEFARQANAATRAKLDADHVALKRLVEARRR